MKVPCPECGKVWEVPEDTSPSARLRCSSCGHVWRAGESAVGAVSTTETAPDARPERRASAAPRKRMTAERSTV